MGRTLLLILLMASTATTQGASSTRTQAQAQPRKPRNPFTAFVRACQHTQSTKPVSTVTTEEAIETGICLGYIESRMEVSAILEFDNQRSGTMDYCLPSTATWLELVKAVLGYAKADPEKLVDQMPRSIGVTKSLKWAFPCPTPK